MSPPRILCTGLEALLQDGYGSPGVTKIIPAISEDHYEVRLEKTGLISLEMRKLQSDLTEVYRIIHSLEGLKVKDHIMSTTLTKGHQLKIYKQQTLKKYSQQTWLYFKKIFLLTMSGHGME